jgi:hypothetical protein
MPAFCFSCCDLLAFGWFCACLRVPHACASPETNARNWRGFGTVLARISHPMSEK